MLKLGQFLSSEQPCDPKSFDVALNIAGVEKNERSIGDSKIISLK